MSESLIENFKHLEIAHSLNRRIRIIAPAIRKDRERAYVLEILLKKRPGIIEVRSEPSIGSIAIRFDPKRLPKPDLLKSLDILLDNLGHKKTIDKMVINPVDSHLPERQFNVSIGGMTCASCALLIEMLLRRDGRITGANVNFATETATVSGRIDQDGLQALIGDIGYQAFPLDTLSQRRLLVKRERQRLREAKWRALVAAALSLPVMMIGMAAPSSRFWHWTQHTLAMPIVLWAGMPFFTKAYKLAKQRKTNMDSLIAMGVGASYGYSVLSLLTGKRGLYFDSATGIITFVLIGRYLEEKAKGKAHQAIRSLVDLQPQNATLLKNGQEVTIPVDELGVDDIVLIRPGEKIPTDGVVTEGISTVDESMITGESLPVIKEPGQSLVGGCINANGAMKMRVTAVGKDTVLANIIHMIDQAQSSRLPIQKTVDTISSVFVPSVIGVAGLTFTASLAGGIGLGNAFSRAIAVLLIACPCSLGLATPIAIMVGTGQSARRGVYIRNGESLETAAKMTMIVFDKTGTITEGKPQVTDFIAVAGQDKNKLLALASGAEAGSEHFLAKALVAYTESLELEPAVAESFENSPGHGIRARVDGHDVLIGTLKWLSSTGIDLTDLTEKASALSEQGKTPVCMSVDDKSAALFGIADRARPNAREAITRLRKLGVTPLMVTGDTEQTARFVAEQVGIERVVAHALPERKLEIIGELQNQGQIVGMIGDGINDAPAIAAADVSFAIGTGTDVAIETADLVLVNGDIAKVAEVMELSEATLRIIKQNLFWALGYNTIAIPVAALGKLNPMIASAAMAFSSISVVLNSLRLQKK